MTQPQREKTLRQFRDDPSYTVLLISLHAGGVGLNLVSANVVFFMDCWWNPGKPTLP
jgi:SNF2 family DNA or RNA helicase